MKVIKTMKIQVQIKPNSKISHVEERNGLYIARVKSSPIENKANLELINILSEYFKISKQNIKIISGLTSKKKTISITK